MRITSPFYLANLEEGTLSGATGYTSCTLGFAILAPGEGVIGVTGNPMGMDVMDLIIHLGLEGPCDEYHVARASDENTPPLGDESANEEEAVDKGEESEREPMEEDDSKMEPMEEEDPDEGFNRGRGTNKRERPQGRSRGGP